MFLIVLVAAGLFALRIWSDELTEVALVPDTEFVEQDPLELNAYQDPDMWFSRPGKGAANDPARWEPAFADAPDARDDAGNPVPAAGPAEMEPPRFAVFFVHPTSFFDRSAWNATLEDTDSQNRARLMVRGLASAFNQASEIWVPRYRQATFGAFITDAPEATQAIDAAYRDIEQAFEFFVDSVPADTPIVLAGHSQGSFHLRRLLAERVSGTPLAERVAVAYVIGWPLSLVHDLPQLGLPPCTDPEQAGCVMSWATFAEPADPTMIERGAARWPGLDGKDVADSQFLCTNPLTGTADGEAPASANTGTLVPDLEAETGSLVPGVVPARCDESGLLLIGAPPALELGPYVLPGNNYHIYDVILFWRNLREDFTRRAKAWPSQR